jgi:hypothetical protein
MGWPAKLRVQFTKYRVEPVVQDRAARLKHEMRTFRRPAHWLTLSHPLINQVAHRGSCWSA